jgi:putative component of membrane protein insertase Oxa1/YidC/SpoIIIJ protein YidD
MIAQFLIFLLRGLRPLLGPAYCKFYVSCTEFAIIQLQEKPLPKACLAIIKRLLSCHPFKGQK